MIASGCEAMGLGLIFSDGCGTSDMFPEGAATGMIGGDLITVISVSFSKFRSAGLERGFIETGGLVIAAMWQRLVEELIGSPPVGAGLPTTVLSVPRRKGDDLLVTLLHYVPVRKALRIDVIAERMNLAGEQLRCDPAIKQVIDVTSGEPLHCIAPGCFELRGKGRLLLRIPGYFAAAD